MSEPTFQIVFRGKILGGFDRPQVRQNLAQLFKTDPARIDAMLDAPKTVLKSGLAKDAAARYQEALRQAGIMVAVIGEVPVSSGEMPQTAAATVSRVAPEVPAAPAAPAVVPNPIPVAPASGGLTLAAAGERILPPKERFSAKIDTASLTLAQAGVTLIDQSKIPPPEFDLSGISVATDDRPIDATPKPPPAAIDISSLSLAEVPKSVEKAPTELQKLLSSSVE